MAAPKKRKVPNEATAELMAALKVIARAQDKTGNLAEKHCRIRDGWIIATNGALSIGLKVNTAFTANPETAELMLALPKTGEQVAFTTVNNGHQLHIKSGRFQVTIENINDRYLPAVVPDLPVAKINPKLLEALTICATVANEAEDNPIFKGVWLDGYSCAASDRFTIIQFWHGIHLPSGAIIPKAAIKAMNEHESELTEFGFSNSTVTFWFKDGSFIQTTLYDGKYPNYTQALDREYNYLKIPSEFFNGLHAIIDFAKDKTVYFHEAKLTTTIEDNGKGAVYEVPGISKGCIFNGERLLVLEKYADEVDFYSERGAAFRSKFCRGIIARRR